MTCESIHVHVRATQWVSSPATITSHRHANGAIQHRLRDRREPQTQQHVQAGANKWRQRRHSASYIFFVKKRFCSNPSYEPWQQGSIKIYDWFLIYSRISLEVCYNSTFGYHEKWRHDWQSWVSISDTSVGGDLIWKVVVKEIECNCTIFCFFSCYNYVTLHFLVSFQRLVFKVSQRNLAL